MNQSEIILAALAAGGENVTFSPVQIQKLFFLIDREIAPMVDGPHFDFQPYDYGPFDRTVYAALDALGLSGKAEMHNGGRYRVYGLTPEGFKEGQEVLNGLQVEARQYISELAAWVRKLSFQQLVASIYNKYPDMKANSVFQG